MAKCMFCDTKNEVWDGEQQGYLILNKNTNGDIHTHGTLEDKELMNELIDAAIEHAEIPKNISTSIVPKEVVFHNRQRIGDMIVFTCAIRDFKKAFPNTRVNVISTAMHIWDNNPYIDRTLIPTEKNTFKIGPSKLTNASNRLDWHFTNAFRVSIEDALNIHIPQGESRGDIWITKEEYNAPRVTEKPYWIICIGGEKGWGCKMYPFEKWQSFVNQNPDILFYQIGSKEDDHPRLKGNNVVDYVGMTQSRETGMRDLIKLFLNAEGSIGLVSFHMHLSGAFNKPCIVVAGAREPVSFTRYSGHQYLATEGCLPCAVTACWHCDIDACKNLVINENSKIATDRKIPKCVDLIQPEDLTRALNYYYQGGRLKKEVASVKPKFKNIVDKKVEQIQPEIKKVETKNYGLPFNAGSVTIRDWEFIKETINKNNIKTVLEFGAGLSTLMLNDLGIKVVTYECSDNWIKKVKEINPKCDIRLWDGKNLELNEKFDFAFVDGPSGGINREFSTKVASEVADIIVIHDASRKNEIKWQNKYLKGKFIGPGGGGQRCHLWSKNKNTLISFRKGSPLMDESLILKNNNNNIIKTNSSAKFVKFVSTARGWGGCARSITTIMKHLIKAGHKVEFIPFRSLVGSSELNECIKNELQSLIVTTNYNTIQEPCDALMMYADDYIWEFDRPEIVSAFSNINAKNKTMMLNYRRGKVGQIPWTKGWDKYMFLNSTQEQELLNILPDVKTKVLPPCTELSEFFKVTPDFNKNVRIVRHNSQGDTKFPKDCGKEIDAALVRLDAVIHMMPGPSFVSEKPGFIKYSKNNPPIPKFLEKGNLFWYSLPKGYMDMGPRVIIEAMAAGLPILADNWGGAVDRITPECGWLCNSKEEMIEIIKNVTLGELEKKGKAARERAKTFLPENWVKEIIE